MSRLPITPPMHGDASALARLLYHAGPWPSRTLASETASRAAIAFRIRSLTGKQHPRWGNGSVMAAALGEIGDRGIERWEPDFSDRRYRACWAMAMDAIGEVIDWPAKRHGALDIDQLARAEMKAISRERMAATQRQEAAE